MVDVVAAHCRHLREDRGLAPSTVYQRERVLSRLIAHLGHDRVLEVGHDDLIGFLARVSGPSRATEISHLRGFYIWALKAGHLTVNPAADLERPKSRRRLPRPMPTEDVARALRDAPARIKPWMYLAAYGGLRACAICQLRVEDVLFDADPPMIFIEVNKGQGMHTVPMSRWLVKALGECNLPAGGWIAPRRDGQSGHLPAWNISHQVNRYLHYIGIPYTLHTLRHWAITEFYKASGRDLRATQEFAGHQTPDSTQVYTWVDPGDIAIATDKMPDLRDQD